MYYINCKEAGMLKLINKYGCIRKEQIEKILNCRDAEDIANKLTKIKKMPIKYENGIFFSYAQKKINKKMLDAIDVYIDLNKNNKVEWCEIAEFPFTLTLYRNGNVYDIAVINTGEEKLLMPAIDRSIAEKVIIKIEDPIQFDKIQTIKECRLCLIKDGEVEFFEAPGKEECN